MGGRRNLSPHPSSQPHSAWVQFSLGQAREDAWCAQGPSQGSELVLELLPVFSIP